MELPTYTELRERYSTLSTPELLEISRKSALTEQARLAMDTELDTRKEETESIRRDGEMLHGRPRKTIVRDFELAKFLLFVSLAFSAWRFFSSWLVGE